MYPDFTAYGAMGNFLYFFPMLRLFLISFLCALFTACSSDDSEALNEWFNDQNLATSYSKDPLEIDIAIKIKSGGFDDSAYTVNSYAALGKLKSMEHSLYFDLEATSPLSSEWTFRTDGVFYADVKSAISDRQKAKKVKISWPEQSAEIDLNWNNDTFYVSLPEGLRELGKNASATDTLKLRVKLQLLSDDVVLRIADPTSDISGLRRVAQKTELLEDCEKCLYAGIRESLLVSFEINDTDREKIAKAGTVVFAQLVLPKQSDTAGSELGLPVPVYVYYRRDTTSTYVLDDYKVDTTYVNNYGHPNLVFWKGDSLKLQVTRNMRNYTAAVGSQPDTLKLLLGFPMLEPNSYYFYNYVYSSKKVFTDRPAYARYDLGSVEKARLKLWFADYGGKK